MISGTYSFLANVANGGRVQNLNGYDIIFTSDCLGVNKLSHEIESYNPATGELVAWVNIPMLSHSVDTVIYLSYGNTQVTTASENSTGVWDSNFFGVFHLGKNGGAPSVVNSTAPNGFNRNNSAIPISGIIDGAAAFANRANIFATPQLPLSHNLTVSTWFNTSIHQTGSNPRLVDENVANLSLNGANVAFSLTSLNQNTSTQLAGVVGTGSGALDGNWHYAVGTYDGSTVKLYLDGQLNASGAAANVLPGNSFVFGVTLGTGAFISPIQTSYIGNLDESRVSSNTRSADWIATEYNNQKAPSTFYTIFPENTSSVNITPSGTLGLYASQTQQFQAFVLGNCSGAPVTWTMSPAGAGSINSAGLYTAPANISAIQSVTITATSQALSTLSASVALRY